MPIETHMHHDPAVSMLVVFGVDLALPLVLALAFVIFGLRRDDDGRSAYFGLAKWSVVVGVVMQLASVGYHARLWLGTSGEGTVTQSEEQLEGKSPRCNLVVETAKGELEIAVPQGHCRGLKPEARVPIITVGESTTFAQVGERATASALLTFGAVPLLVLLVAGLVVRATR